MDIYMPEEAKELLENNALSIKKPGPITRPVVGDGSVKEIVMERYGLTVTEVTELNSYMDRNYYIQVNSHHSNSRKHHLHEAGYVVKIYNSEISQDLELFGETIPEPYYLRTSDAQHALMSHFIQNKIPAQIPVPTLHGGLYSLEVIHPNQAKKGTPGNHVVEVRTFIPGRIIQEVPYTTNLLLQAGHLIADIKQALKRFDNDYYTKSDPRKCLWSLMNVPLLTQYTFCLDNEDRKLIDDIISHFTSRVVTKFSYLPRGYIHGDPNEQNILVSKNQSGDYDICGILDFTLAEYSFPVFDLVINAAYLMIDSDLVDQLDAPGYILAGFFSTENLTEVEWEILVPCIAGKLAQSLTIGAHTHLLEPDNKYVLNTAKKGWSLLRKYWAASESSLVSKWKDIISSFKHVAK